GARSGVPRDPPRSRARAVGAPASSADGRPPPRRGSPRRTDAVIGHLVFSIDRRRVLRAALGLAAGALTALVYRASLDNPLIFDDRTSILRNPSLVATW